jgi:uncharacterized protein (DUF736 family)
MNQKRDMTGALFVNTKKNATNHPDYNGSITINGVEYWLSGWKKTSESGVHYMSLAIKPKEQPQQDNYFPPQEDFF